MIQLSATMRILTLLADTHCQNCSRCLCVVVRLGQRRLIELGISQNLLAERPVVCWIVVY